MVMTIALAIVALVAAATTVSMAVVLLALVAADVLMVLVAAALAGLVLRVRRAGGAASRVERRGRRGLARDRGGAAQANDEGKHADGCGQRPARTREAPRLTLFPLGLRPSSLLDAVEVEGARRGALRPQPLIGLLELLGMVVGCTWPHLGAAW